MRFLGELYREEPVSIPVGGSPEEAARSLREQTRHWYSVRLMDAVVGSVAVDRVVLRVSRRFSNNAFAPIFHGQFTTWQGKTSLTGSFALRWWVQVFVTIWFCAIGVFAFAFLVIGATASRKDGESPVPGILAGVITASLALGFGYLASALVRCGIRWARRDIEEILEHVQAAVGENVA